MAQHPGTLAYRVDSSIELKATTMQTKGNESLRNEVEEMKEKEKPD